MTATDYDYVIVGAGSAGSALAARLSEDPSVTVCLLEAGGRDRAPQIHIPAAFSTLFRGADDWNYDTVPQPHLDGRTIYWPRGKVLGGSSSLNAMMWVRGFAADYDGWAEAAGDAWSFAALQPYFARAEAAIDVADQRSPRAHTAAYLRAVQQAGLAVVDPNTDQPNGFSQTRVNQRRGSRFSSVNAYLRPASKRSNLTVITGFHATAVVIEDGHAVAVTGRTAGTTRRIGARREVVLSGGAVNTPQLLQLSGIGDGGALAAIGISPVVDAPEVGRNLRDHLTAGLIIETAGDTLYRAQSARQVIDYLIRRRGMLTSNVAEAYGFIRSRPELALPDLELIFAPVAFANEGLTPPPAHGLTLGAVLLQPRSTGSVTLASADPLVAPVIDPRYLSDPADRVALMAGLAVCEQLLSMPSLAERSGPGYVVPAGGESLTSEARRQLAIDRYSHTLYHPVGTARMGADRESVVDPELRVRGVTGLRVADASVMPMIIRGHTHAPSVVIGEKAADLIRAARPAG